MDAPETIGQNESFASRKGGVMERTGAFRATSHVTWWGAGAVGCGVAVLVLSFRPWFQLEAAQRGADLDAVLPVEQAAWGSVLGALAVATSVLGAVLVLVPAAADVGLPVWPASIGAVLALVRVGLPPHRVLLGEDLAYGRTVWLLLAVTFAVVGAACAVLCASLRNQERVD